MRPLLRVSAHRGAQIDLSYWLKLTMPATGRHGLADPLAIRIAERGSDSGAGRPDRAEAGQLEDARARQLATSQTFGRMRIAGPTWRRRNAGAFSCCDAAAMPEASSLSPQVRTAHAEN